MLLSAREAAERLGIKVDTLYAYVSRGQLESVEIAHSRERHYDADAIERFLVARGGRGGQRPPETLVPVIGSAICLIAGHRFYYRGEDVLVLAETATLEDVAALLWEEAPVRRGGDRVSGRPPDAGLGLIERCQVRLAELSARDYAALDLTRAGVVRTGGAILDALTECIAGGETGPVHVRLAGQWRLDAAGADLVRRALVLLADHELNASTFVARCIASTAATPYAVVSGAIAALSGRRHGGASARAEAMCQALGDTDPVAEMAARLARDEALPGMGHPLYPEGDPRAAALLAAAKRAVPAKAAWIDEVAGGATHLAGTPPNVDFGLGVAAAVLGLPSGAAFSIFLVARTVGWIAHAIEQYDSRVLIRPRARYTGQRRVVGA